MFTNRTGYATINFIRRRSILNANERVRSLREFLHMSQEQFGNSIGLTKSGISNIENGTRNVSEKHIKLISITHNVCEEWLRNGIEPMLNQTDETIVAELATKYHLRDVDREMLRVFLNMKQEQREKFVDFAVAFVSGFVDNPALKALLTDDEKKQKDNPATDENGREETVRVFQAAKSEDNREMGYTDIPRTVIDKLRNASDVDEL